MDSYPWYTPYQFAGNVPIMCSDIDGLESKQEIVKPTPTLPKQTVPRSDSGFPGSTPDKNKLSKLPTDKLTEEVIKTGVKVVARFILRSAFLTLSLVLEPTEAGKGSDQVPKIKVPENVVKASTPKPDDWDNKDINEKIEWLEKLEKPDVDDMEELEGLRKDTDKSGTKAKLLDKKTISEKFNTTEEDFHKDVKKKIKSKLKKVSESKLQSDNPNILVSPVGHIILEHPTNKKRVNTGTPSEIFKK